MRRLFATVFPLAFLLALPRPAAATSVVPPRDLGHLARISDAVVFAGAVAAWPEEGETLPSTVTRFHLLRQVAGSGTGTVFEVVAPGGAVGARGAAVAGAPRFVPGRQYLLFLDRAPGSRWRAKTMAYGLLEEVEGADLLRPLPEAAGIVALPRPGVEPVGLYRKAALLDHLEAVARGARWDRSQAAAGGALTTFPATAAATASADCAFLADAGDGLPIRWFGHETGSNVATIVATTPGQSGIADGGVAAVERATAAWTDHPDSAIRYDRGGTQARNAVCSGNFDFQAGAVLFDDPCDDLPDLANCVGTLAFGGALYDRSQTQSHDGQRWHPASGSFMVINDGAQCVGAVNFEEVVSHELGHTLGFGHHTPADPADALMSGELKGDGLGAAIRPTDETCAAFAYHTFLDVPLAHQFWRHVEAVENARITRGCSTPAFYCPQASVTRAEMAVFLVRGEHGGGFVPPPASGTLFQDVPASHWAADSIEQLYADGITKGCTASLYCPDELVQRDQMAVFLVRARRGRDFAPPAATGIFADVPASYWAAPFIEQLYRDQITTGCATNPLRYCPTSNVQRGEMAAFLARTFGLPLP